MDFKSNPFQQFAVFAHFNVYFMSLSCLGSRNDIKPFPSSFNEMKKVKNPLTSYE